MKTALAVLCVVLVALSVAACGKEEAAKPAGIQGTWKIVDASGAMAETNKGNGYEFRADGTLVMSLGGFKNEAKYTVAGENVSWTVGGVTVEATFSVQNDTMKMELKNSDQKFVMKRQ